MDLNFEGPITVGKAITATDSEVPQGSGVYLWVYGKPYFQIPGYYCGVTRKSLNERLLTHIKSLMGGYYSIPNRDFSEYKHPTQSVLACLREVSDDWDRKKEIILSSSFYYCVVNDAACADKIEIALIQTLKERAAKGILKGFIENATFHGTRNDPELGVVLKIVGPSDIMTAFGPSIEYPESIR